MNTFFDDWKKNFDHFKLQANLGKMDLVEAFEKQKDQLKTWIHDTKTQLDKSGELAEEQATKIKAKLEELNLQLHLGKAETSEAFDEQRKKIETALHEVYVSNKVVFEKGYNQTMQLFDANADWFKTNLEIMKLQFTLAKMDAKDDITEVKNELNQKLQELQTKSTQWQALAKENIEQWNELAKENMEKFRLWMQNLGK